MRPESSSVHVDEPTRTHDRHALMSHGRVALSDELSCDHEGLYTGTWRARVLRHSVTVHHILAVPYPDGAAA